MLLNKEREDLYERWAHDWAVQHRQQMKKRSDDSSIEQRQGNEEQKKINKPIVNVCPAIFISCFQCLSRINSECNSETRGSTTCMLFTRSNTAWPFKTINASTVFAFLVCLCPCFLGWLFAYTLILILRVLGFVFASLFIFLFVCFLSVCCFACLFAQCLSLYFVWCAFVILFVCLVLFACYLLVCLLVLLLCLLMFCLRQMRCCTASTCCSFLYCVCVKGTTYIYIYIRIYLFISFFQVSCLQRIL